MIITAYNPQIEFIIKKVEVKYYPINKGINFSDNFS